MNTICVSKSKLKAKMLQYFRQVEQTGVELLVTDHGKPTLRVTQIGKTVRPQDAFGEIREKAAIYGDLLEPETDEWGDV